MLASGLFSDLHCLSKSKEYTSGRVCRINLMFIDGLNVAANEAMSSLCFCLSVALLTTSEKAFSIFARSLKFFSCE